MLGDIEAGQVDAVVAWASDRLHRRLDDLVEFVTLVEHRGTAVATVKSGDVDLGTPHGRLVARILGSVAQGEVEQKGERQRRANQQRADAGVPRFTRRPYGYSPDGRRLDRAEAAVVRKAAREVLAGTSLMDVTRRLNAAGKVTSTGGPWTVTTLRRVLTSPRLAGLNVYRGEVVGKGDWAALLNEDTHRAVVSLLGDPSRRTATTNVRKYLLSGLVRCGKCGGPMYASLAGSPTASWMVYRCRIQHLARRLDLVDEVVNAVVVERLSRPDAPGLLVDDQAEDPAALRDEAVALRGRLEEAASLFAAGELTGEQLRLITARVRGDLHAVEARQPSTGRSEVLGELLLAGDVATAWGQVPRSRRRAVIDILMEVSVLPAGKGARFDPERIKFKWR